jgi:hypothetical protein
VSIPKQSHNPSNGSPKVRKNLIDANPEIIVWEYNIISIGIRTVRPEAGWRQRYPRIGR